MCYSSSIRHWWNYGFTSRSNTVTLTYVYNDGGAGKRQDKGAQGFGHEGDNEDGQVSHNLKEIKDV